MMKFLEEIRNFSRSEKLFIFFCMITGFLISAEYATTRPASSAIFLSVFSSNAIPWVWLASVPFNLLIVTLYNRFLPSLGPLKMIGFVCLIVVGIHTLSALLLKWISWLILIQFMVKDVYILLMFKQLWSMIHSTIRPTRAKYLYGTIFAAGTLGSTFGSLIPSFCAVSLGSESLFLFTLPVYLGLYFAFREAYRRSSIQEQVFKESINRSRSVEGFSLIRKSSYLAAVLLLVVFMQVSVGLMDFQFNTYLETNILEKDLRTEYVGKIVGLTNSLSLLLQVAGGLLMIQLLGVRGSHLAVPLMLLGNGLVMMVLPTFSIVSLAYIFIKSIDFSIFGVIREMLYIPMRLDEKYRAKAIIDVFAYRSSKAFVSIFILALQFILGSEINQAIHYVSIFVFFSWLAVVFFLLKQPQLAIAEPGGVSKENARSY